MTKFRLLLATTVLSLLLPGVAIAQSALDDMSSQVEALETQEAHEARSGLPSEQITEIGQRSFQTQGFTQSRPPDVWGNATSGN